VKPSLLFGLGVIIALASCSTSSTLHEKTHFSRTDSLTDIYLVLQDSLLQSWNRVISMEMNRQEALGNIINDLQRSTLISDDEWKAYHASLEQLERIRFTQKSMTDPHVIEEYDKACSELLRQLTLLSIESARLQTAANELTTFDESNVQYRLLYDSIAREFNTFIQLNSTDLGLDSNLQLEKKPLFQSVSNH
jgi:hypothetical protein